jgi:hypothetical protein
MQGFFISSGEWYLFRKTYKKEVHKPWPITILISIVKNVKQIHPAGLKISIKSGPPIKMSVGAFYAGKQVPPKIADLIDSHVLCPKTGKMFTQKDIHQIFLVPVK